MSLLQVTNLSIGYGARVLLNGANFRLLRGEHIGLVGPNGEGKSTFLNIITGKISPDAGRIEWHKHARVGYLDQHSSLEAGKSIRDVCRESFDYLYELEQTMYALYEESANDLENMDKILEEAGEIGMMLESSGFYIIDAKIDQVASGLGLMDIGMDTDVSKLSGGQRSKVLLTKLLLSNPGILLLDEPTNFLDESHINWLRNFLINYENAFVLVSHDVEFLNSCVNVIYHVEEGVLTRYVGDYHKFMEMLALKKDQQAAAYEKQQKEIQGIETFIAKNKARAATANMAMSRQKKLDKMEKVQRVTERPKPNFSFKTARTPGRTIFETTNLVIGYKSALTKPLNIALERNQKIAIKGANGIGKTTLLKTLMGVLNPYSGSVFTDPFVEVGYFAQEEISPNKTALEEIQDTFPAMTNAEVRGALAAMGLTRLHIESKIQVLSGGEQAKVRLCKITLQPSNVLMLDEPTNHLDVDAKAVLKEAIQNYKGTVLLVSHDPIFYKDIVDEEWDAEKWSTK